MKPTVVILLSDKRSGSTMVEQELCRHPEIRHVAYSPHTYNETHHWLKAAVVLGLPSSMFSGGRVYPGYGSQKNAYAYLVDGIIGNVPEFEVPADDRELVFQGWEALCKQYARPVFFEKSPQHLAQWGALALMLEWAEHTEFDVRFICLIRNPLSVMYSASNLFGTDPKVRQFGWVEIQRNLLAFQSLVRSEQYYQLRYEELVSNPAREFGKVCSFIGVEEDESIGKKVHGQSLEKWRTDPDFAFQLDPLVHRMAIEYGYSESDLENNPRDRKSTGRTVRKTGFGRLGLNFRNRWLKPAWLRMKLKGRN